jgi:hypothetical protein
MKLMSLTEYIATKGTISLIKKLLDIVKKSKYIQNKQFDKETKKIFNSLINVSNNDYSSFERELNEYEKKWQENKESKEIIRSGRYKVKKLREDEQIKEFKNMRVRRSKLSSKRKSSVSKSRKSLKNTVKKSSKKTSVSRKSTATKRSRSRK